jgi:hypothetical protein
MKMNGPNQPLVCTDNVNVVIVYVFNTTSSQINIDYIVDHAHGEMERVKKSM